MHERVLVRIILACILGAVSTANAAPSIEIQARCAAELARDPAHLRTLRGELTLALDGVRATASYTLDVSLVRLEAKPIGRDVEVRVELRALLSDARGIVLWSSTSRALARGSARDKALVQRDALTSAARGLARTVRARAQ